MPHQPGAGRGGQAAAGRPGPCRLQPLSHRRPPGHLHHGRRVPGRPGGHLHRAGAAHPGDAQHSGPGAGRGFGLQRQRPGHGRGPAGGADPVLGGGHLRRGGGIPARRGHGIERQRSGLRVHLHRGDDRRWCARRSAPAPGRAAGAADGLRVGATGAGNRRASGRAQGQGDLARRHHHRRTAGARRGGLPRSGYERGGAATARSRELGA